VQELTMNPRDASLFESDAFRLTRRGLLRMSAFAAVCGRTAWSSVSDADQAWAQSTLASLSLEERVGQMMSVHAWVPGLNEGVRRGRVGSLQVPRGGDTTVRDVLDFINSLQSQARVPLLMMGAVEGGMGYVTREATLLPANMAIGATASEQLAYAAGNVSAKEARALGIDWPGETVADVNSNPANPIINTRSFGDSPALVSRLLVAFIRGQQEERVISQANHFPGHGATSQDSHLELAIVDRGLEELTEVDLPPFVAAINACVSTMCTAHIRYPALEPDERLPATMSYAILTNLLRKKLGFRGFVHSDSFAMDAIRKNFPIDEAAVQSIRAGCDILLSYPDWDVCFDAVLKQAEVDPEFRRRVDESVLRILPWKHWIGLPERKPLNYDDCLAVLSNPQHKQVALDIARAAVTAVRGEEFLKSLKSRERVLCVFGNPPKPPVADGAAQSMLRDMWPAARILELDAEPTPQQRDSLKAETSRVDAIVYLGFTQVRSHDPDSVRFPKPQVSVIQQLCDARPTAVMSFGSPYALQDIKSAAALACTYDAVPACLQAGIEALTGAIPWSGRLPVQLG
jgi:beta-N-acetylhexosaminidase